VVGVIVAILGAGGHGMDIADIAEALDYSPDMYDDNPDLKHPAIKIAVGRGLPYVIGVNSPKTRRLIAAQLPAGWNLGHPTVTGWPMNKGGLVVGAHTSIGPKVTVGAHVHIGAGCTITRTSVGSWTTIGPGVNVAGNVEIGKGVFIGVGATVRDFIKIGHGATIGAGANVVDSVPAGVTVKGNPAR
jgi:acetyltransferase-like isoleucine patch superfamily enzyme